MTRWRTCAGIHCPIGLYKKHDGEIVRLTEAINRSPTAGEMAQAGMIYVSAHPCCSIAAPMTTTT